MTSTRSSARPSPRPSDGPHTWVVTDGAAGIENQCYGLARRLGLEPVIKRIAIRQPWLSLPPALWIWPLHALSGDGDSLTPPWPDLLIASGRKSVAPAAAIGKLSGGRTLTVQIQKPGVDPRRFDLVVAPRHDDLAGDNVIETSGSIHGLTRDLLDREAEHWADRVQHLPGPVTFAALGGPNRVYRFGESEAAALGRKLAGLPGGLLVTISRRTTQAAADALKAELDPSRCLFWDGSGDNPYRAWLGLADAVVVTSDSVNMATEACITGRPVYVAHLDGGSAKFRAFHALLERAGHTRRFDGVIDTDTRVLILDDAGRVAERVSALLKKNLLS